MLFNNKEIKLLAWLVSYLNTEEKNGIISSLSRECGISKPAASKFVKKCIQGNWLSISASKSRPFYALGKNRLICKTYQRTEVEEHIIWERDFSRFFPLPQNINDILHYGFTEIVNNARDHSNGGFVYMLICLKEKKLTVFIADDGLGIFRKIQEAFDLPDPRLSLLELAKGKLTTDSKRSVGKGLFFTSKMFDSFEIDSNHLQFQHGNRFEKDILFESPFDLGTAVLMEIDISSTKTTKAIFDQFDASNAFNKTIVPVKLAGIGGENLISRSQAKRLVNRLESFETVVLDFSEVDQIGQAFADEVFRVFQNCYPKVDIIPINASEEVKKMIKRIQSANK